MKMIRAIVRPDAADSVAEALADAGFYSMTQVHAFGRGKQKGISLGSIRYDELPKTMILMVAEDDDVEEIVKLVNFKAYTGNFGDGKVFVSPVDEAFTVRTGQPGL
ncbi:nitrogen regulatory protein P-II [Thiorhodococcus drewsii AZ1]|uniref:Nitrogen regulatory protein P-II n=1 Tax=Thiorhodococcus drewsii AZ1 TaxID=765913 RepID=G2E4N1_9GAMM|nr:P-II family nitrogen regulator [Thiorhodococcus drewsii]EGV29507.1 nitrogen regulatory protein P-II [Thiorhodococcus drewsii AZ1]